jgi:hypothetical protein
MVVFVAAAIIFERVGIVCRHILSIVHLLDESIVDVCWRGALGFYFGKPLYSIVTIVIVDSALYPGAPAGHQANSTMAGEPSTATNWLCLVRTLFRAPQITKISSHKFS